MAYAGAQAPAKSRSAGSAETLTADFVARPFRFLDLARGDASASVEALGGTLAASYRGVDPSTEFLRLHLIVRPSSNLANSGK